MSDHGGHIRRHLRELREVFPADRVDRLTARLRLPQGSQGPEQADLAYCLHYLEGVRFEIGEMAYRLARVNFTLVGCLAVAAAYEQGVRQAARS
jgi:hypothetical protein